MVLTAWPEFAALDWKRIGRAMAQPRVVFDGRNCLPDGLADAGVVHLRVGRPEQRPALPAPTG